MGIGSFSWPDLLLVVVVVVVGDGGCGSKGGKCWLGSVMALQLGFEGCDILFPMSFFLDSFFLFSEHPVRLI